MTAAEQIYHTASLKNTTAPSAASMDTNTYSSASARLNVADVSSQFNLEYYNTMSRQPDHLHGFYGKQSQMVHSVEGDLEAPICTTLEAVHARILAMGYQGARIIVESIDAQASLNGGIFILTTGNMKLKSGSTKKFVQSFFLAEQPNGYYVLNDCFRFIESTGAATAPQKVAEPVQKPVAEVKKVAEPVKEVPAPVAPVVKEAPKEKQPEPVKEQAPLEKAVSKPQPAKKAAAAPAEPPKKTTPSSWASLAAGGSDMWQNGVVAPTKTPVVTLSNDAPKDSVRRDVNVRSSAAPKIVSNPEKRTDERRGDERRGDERRGDRTAVRGERDNRSPRPDNKPLQDFSRSVFIRNLGSNPDAAALRKVLESIGSITSFDFHLAKSQAFVEFQTAQMAIDAVNGKFSFNGANLNIDLRRPAGQRQGGNPRTPRPQSSE